MSRVPLQRIKCPVKSFLLAVLLMAAHPTEAETHTTMHRSPHTEHSSWLVGVKGVQLTVVPAAGDTLVGGGAGVFAERTAIEGWLEVELSASFVRVADEDEWIIPVDVLLKKPFHIGAFCPYFAIGPTAAFVKREEENRVVFGGVAVIGAYYWLGDSFGIDLEVDYAVVSEDGVQHEVTVAAGPTFRF